MLSFLLRRLLMLIVALLVSSFIIFSALYVAPGNPIAVLSGGRSLPPSAIKVLEHRYHLDQPFFVRYFEYIKGVLHGDLGYSIIHQENVSTLVRARVGTTLELVLYASILIIVVGVGLGLIGGLRKGAADTGVVVVSTISAAIPSFVAAILLVSIFAVNLGWFPAQGNGVRGVRPVQAPDPAGHRARDLLDGAGRARDPYCRA